MIPPGNRKQYLSFGECYTPKNSKEEGQIHHCPSETSCIKYWSGPYLGFAEKDSELGQSGACKDQDHKAKVLPTYIQWGQANILKDFFPTYLLPMCDQAHSMWLEQPIYLQMWKHTSCCLT